ncbi:hypothetical protein [Actinoallomurus sp. NPDC052274]|uniref:hypothetical protein n=1 Tax=Actinoallomurus sp. NPDC052274 TaxID=3155420 RepID=UPI0034224B62
MLSSKVELYAAIRRDAHDLLRKAMERYGTVATSDLYGAGLEQSLAAECDGAAV